MSSDHDIERSCKEIADLFSACDVSDALLKLNVPQAGFLPDITPISDTGTRHVRPVSTVLFVAKSHTFSSATSSPIQTQSNIPEGQHWTDLPSPGSIVLVQQPRGQVCAVLGDILATRLKVRGIKGVVADGRIRDVSALTSLCKDGDFTAWSRGTSTVGTGLEANVWAVNVPLRVGDAEVRPGDIICVDEAERGCVVIPRDKLPEVIDILPALKQADDRCVADVARGMDVSAAFRRHR